MLGALTYRSFSGCQASKILLRSQNLQMYLPYHLTTMDHARLCIGCSCVVLLCCAAQRCALHRSRLGNIALCVLVHSLCHDTQEKLLLLLKRLRICKCRTAQPAACVHVLAKLAKRSWRIMCCMLLLCCYGNSINHAIHRSAVHASAGSNFNYACISLLFQQQYMHMWLLEAAER